jgi:lysophospholipase L1-like esterase
MISPMITSMISPMITSMLGGDGSIPIGTRILLVGDSTTYGRGANPAGVAGVVGAHINSPCRQLARKLTASGVTANSNSVVGLGSNSNADSTELYFNATPDVAVTLNGWAQLDFDSIGGNLYNNAGAGILTFSFDNVDKGAIGLPVRSYGIIEYRIDGGAWTQVNQTGADDLLRIEVGFGSVGAHTVELQRNSGGFVYVSYVEAWDSSAQVVVVPWGARGYTSGQLNDSARPWSYKSALSHVPFDAVILNVGINDVRSGGSGINQATYEANVTAYVNAIKTANPAAVIFIQIPNDISTGLSYLPAAITGLASALDLMLLDSRLAVNMATFTEADAAGNMYDLLHPTDTGYSSEYDYFTPIIKAAL